MILQLNSEFLSWIFLQALTKVKTIQITFLHFQMPGIALKSIASLFDALYQKGLQLVTKIRKNMNNSLMPLFDKLLLRKIALIESVNDQFKNLSQIEHSRHRSFSNFRVNLVSGLAAYCLQPKKPSLNLHHALAII